MDLSHILNWELKAGSHEFPGPSGGTCINEAAIVAAGFEYRAVRSSADCPPCFCQVLAEFAISVNDECGDDQRQALLLPLVMRLAGSRDAEAWVQCARATFILMEMERQVFSPVLDLPPSSGAFAREQRAAMKGVKACIERALRFRSESPVICIREVSSAVQICRMIVKYDGPAPVKLPAPTISSSLSELRVQLREDDVWALAAEALSRAFRIGTQAPVADTAQVVERMEVMKAQAAERAKADA